MDTVFNFDLKNEGNAYKFYSALDGISKEELEKRFNFLKSKDIVITRPSQMKVLALSFEELKERVENGPLDQIKEDPCFLLDSRSFALNKEEAKEITKEDSVNNSSKIEEVLSSPRTIDLDTDTYERYEKLDDGVKHICESLNNPLFNEQGTILNNVIKLVVTNTGTDEEILYYAFTFKHNYPDEINKMVKDAIKRELSIDNPSLGGR